MYLFLKSDVAPLSYTSKLMLWNKELSLWILDMRAYERYWQKYQNAKPIDLLKKIKQEKHSRQACASDSLWAGLMLMYARAANKEDFFLDSHQVEESLSSLEWSDFSIFLLDYLSIKNKSNKNKTDKDKQILKTLESKMLRLGVRSPYLAVKKLTPELLTRRFGPTITEVLYAVFSAEKVSKVIEPFEGVLLEHPSLAFPWQDYQEAPCFFLQRNLTQASDQWSVIAASLEEAYGDLLKSLDPHIRVLALSLVLTTESKEDVRVDLGFRLPMNPFVDLPVFLKQAEDRFYRWRDTCPHQEEDFWQAIESWQLSLTDICPVIYNLPSLFNDDFLQNKKAEDESFLDLLDRVEVEIFRYELSPHWLCGFDFKERRLHEESHPIDVDYLNMILPFYKKRPLYLKKGFIDCIQGDALKDHFLAVDLNHLELCEILKQPWWLSSPPYTSDLLFYQYEIAGREETLSRTWVLSRGEKFYYLGIYS